MLLVALMALMILRVRLQGIATLADRADPPPPLDQLALTLLHHARYSRPSVWPVVDLTIRAPADQCNCDAARHCAPLNITIALGKGAGCFASSKHKRPLINHISPFMQ